MTKGRIRKLIERSRSGIWIALMILMPLIIATFFTLFQVVIKKADPFPGIIWNDEAVYLKLIETYAKSASPLGYWGFNAEHAILGSGPAWSPAIIMPYAIFAKIFPVGRSFVFFINLIYLLLANVAFYFLAKPSKEECIGLAGMEAFSVPILLYLTTNMSELFRYAVAIVLAGMIYYIYFKKGKVWIKYILIPLFLLYSVQVYIFFAFAIPLYISGLMKNKKWPLRFLVSLPVTLVVTGGSYYFLHLISSNYNIGKTEGLLTALSSGDILGAIKNFFSMMKEGIGGIWYLKNYFQISPLYPYSVILAFSIIVVGLFMAFREKMITDKKTDPKIGRIVAHSVALFYLMYLTLYTIVPDTFYRGTQIVVIFSLYLIVMCEREYIVRFFLLFSLAGVFLMHPQLKTFTENRYTAMKEKDDWNELKLELNDIMVADPKKDLWDNTVLMYTMEPKVICAVPTGLAQNYVLEDGFFDEKPGYLLFSKTPDEKKNPEWIEKSYESIYSENKDVLDKNYIVIYETDSYIIYKKGQK